MGDLLLVQNCILTKLLVPNSILTGIYSIIFQESLIKYLFKCNNLDVSNQSEPAQHLFPVLLLRQEKH